MIDFESVNKILVWKLKINVSVSGRFDAWHNNDINIKVCESKNVCVLHFPKFSQTKNRSNINVSGVR